MAIFDFLKPKSKEPKLMRRQYAAASTSRLYSDFFDSNRSADSELYPVIRRMRNRSRDLARNNEYVKRYLDLLKNNVVGEEASLFKLRRWTLLAHWTSLVIRRSRMRSRIGQRRVIAP